MSTIRELTRSDIPAVSAIAFASLKDDLLYNYLFPGLKQHPEDFHRAYAIGLRNRLVRPGLHGFVAVTDEDEKTMGYAFFERVRGAKKDKNAKRWIQDSWLNTFERYLLSWEFTYNTLFDRTSNPANLTQYSKARAHQKSFYKDLAPYWHVSILAVSPDYQRRGVGTLLVREGQRLALLDEVPLVLESSPAGRGLYEKNGFERLWEGKTCGLDDVIMVWCPGAEDQLESEGGLEVSKKREELLRKVGKLRGKMGKGMREWELMENPEGTWGEFVKGQDE